jgi:hypothetical protein
VRERERERDNRAAHTPGGHAALDPRSQHLSPAMRPTVKPTTHHGQRDHAVVTSSQVRRNKGIAGEEHTVCKEICKGEKHGNDEALRLSILHNTTG